MKTNLRTGRRPNSSRPLLPTLLNRGGAAERDFERPSASASLESGGEIKGNPLLSAVRLPSLLPSFLVTLSRRVRPFHEGGNEKRPQSEIGEADERTSERDPAAAVRGVASVRPSIPFCFFLPPFSSVRSLPSARPSLSLSRLGQTGSFLRGHWGIE